MNREVITTTNNTANNIEETLRERVKMSRYTNDFIKDAISSFKNNASTAKFEEYYNANRQFNGYGDFDFQSFVRQSIELNFNSALRGPLLKEAIRKLKAAVKSRVQYLYNKSAASLSLPMTDKKNALNYMVTYSDEMKLRICGFYKEEQIISYYMEELKNWKESGEPLIFFPIDEYKAFKKKKFEDFKMDIALAVWNYVAEVLDGDITSYSNYYLKEFVGLPLMPITPFTTSLVPNESGVYESVIKDEGGQLLVRMYSNVSTHQVLVNDAKIILDYLIRLVEDNLADIVKKGGIIEAPLSESTNLLVNYSTNSQTIERSKNVWRYIRNIQFEYRNDLSEERNFSILNDLTFPVYDNTDFVRIEVSNAYIQQIVQNNIVGVKTLDYNLLENSVSKLLMHALTVKQLISVEDDDGFVELDYYFFISNIQFKGNRAENIKLIEEGFDEYVAKHVLISEYYKGSNGNFFVKFINRAV